MAFILTPEDILISLVSVIGMSIFVSIYLLYLMSRNKFQLNIKKYLIFYGIIVSLPPLIVFNFTLLHHQVYIVNMMLLIFALFIMYGVLFSMGIIIIFSTFILFIVSILFSDMNFNAQLYGIFLLLESILLSGISSYLIEKNQRKLYLAKFKEEELNQDILAKDVILQHQTKLAQMGEMIGNIAHQWRQPLSTISVVTSSIKLNHELNILDLKKIPENMNIIENKVAYLSSVIETFNNFLKMNKHYEDFDIDIEINNAVEIVHSTLQANNIKIKDERKKEIKLIANVVVGELPQVIINIFNNAKDILVEKKIKNPFVLLQTNILKNKIIITIEDNAGGIPDDIITKIFNPYFTTKDADLGTGLGLHMSHRIITQSLKGDIYVTNTNIGAKFFIELPLTLENRF